MVDDRTAIVEHEVGGTPNYSSTSLTSPVGSVSSPAALSGLRTNSVVPEAVNNEVFEIEPVGDHTDSPPPPLPKGFKKGHNRGLSVAMAKEYGDGDYTADEVIEYMGLGTYQKLWICLYGFSSMAQASEVTLSSVILNTLACDWDLTLIEAALIPTLVILSALPGDFIGGYMSDRVGRKRLIIIGQWIIAVSGVISAFMPGYYTYLAVRMCTGFGFGVVTPLVIVQVLEISATQYRVYGVAINFLMWAIGDIYVDLEAYWLLNSYGWRYVVLVAAIPSVIMAFVILLMDESPKYCLVSNRKEEAQAIVEKMCKMNGQEPLPGTISSIEELERGDPGEMFTPKYRQRSIAFCISFLFANATYFMSIYATPNLFSDGYCSDDPSTSMSCTFTLSDLISTLEVSFAELLAIPIFAVVTNAFGRIKTAYILSGATTVILFILLWCFGTLPLTIELCALRAITDSMVLLLYVFAPESYPTYMRSVSFGVIMVFCNLGGASATLVVYMIGVGYSYTTMFEIFLGCSVITCICTLFYENETTGHRLHDNRTVMSPSETARGRDFTTPGDQRSVGDEDLGSLGSEHFSEVGD